MAELARFLTLDDLPLGPRVFRDGDFLNKLAPVAELFGSSDAMFASHSNSVGDAAGADPLADAAPPVDAAEAAHQAQLAAGVDPTAGRVIDAGTNVDGLRASVIRFLPPPDTSPDLSFSEPPIPPPHLVDPGAHQPGDEPPPPRLPAP